MPRCPTEEAVIALAMAGAWLPVAASPASDELRGSAFTQSADEIDNVLAGASERRSLESELGPLAPVADAWRSLWDTVDESLGLNVTFAYTALYQAATNGVKTGPAVGAAGDFDIIGRWRLIRPDATSGWLNAGVLGFATEYRHRMGRATPAQLGEGIGSLWGTTSGFNEQDPTLIQLWWQQRFLDDTVELRFGKIDLATVFDVYRFNSSNFYYLNAAFSDNPAIPFPENGLGVVLGWAPDDRWTIACGVSDAEGRKTETPKSSLDQIKAWFSAASIAWQGPVGSLGDGLYQLTLWHSDRRSGSTAPSAGGFSLVAQQELGDGWVPFARYAYSSDSAVAVKHLLTAGAVLEAPLGRVDDRFGFALGWGAPHDRSLHSQWAAELFYRMSPLSFVELTPHVQVIFKPSRSTSTAVCVVGLRGRLAF